MKFKGKVAVWFYLVMAFVAAVELPIMYASLLEGDAVTFVIILAALVLVEGFMLSMVFRNYAVLGESSLKIAFSFFTLNINYCDITDVHFTKNPLSSLAASIDRIHIGYKRTTVMIALKDKEKFLNEIKLRCSL